MTTGAAMAPDERALRAHLESPAFLDGVGRGRWRLVGVEWPHVLVAVAAAPRDRGPDEFFFRFDLAGYPVEPPTAAPWDPDANRVLDQDRRPKGGRAGPAFRPDWKSGAALYLPFDRVALEAHPQWRTQYRHRAWNGRRDLAWALRFLHDLLNDPDYLGV